MGTGTRQGFDELQCGQEGRAGIHKPHAGNRRRLPVWKHRALKYGAVCAFVLVCALAFAIATGKPVPDVMGQIFGLLVSVLMGV